MRDFGEWHSFRDSLGICSFLNPRNAVNIRFWGAWGTLSTSAISIFCILRGLGGGGGQKQAVGQIRSGKLRFGCRIFALWMGFAPSFIYCWWFFSCGLCAFVSFIFLGGGLCVWIGGLRAPNLIPFRPHLNLSKPFPCLVCLFCFFFRRFGLRWATPPLLTLPFLSCILFMFLCSLFLWVFFCAPR